VRRKKQEWYDKISDKLTARYHYSRLDEDRIRDFVVDYKGGMGRKDILNKYNISYNSLCGYIRKLKGKNVLTEQSLIERRKAIEQTKK